jgi:hypothetical protein
VPGFQLRTDHQQIPGVIYDSTVPFFGAHDDYPLIQDRTGVLLRVADHFFLLTAVHELDQWFDLAAKALLPDATVFTSSGEVVYQDAAKRGPETISLTFGWCEFFDPEILDVAILELDAASVSRLGGKTFLTINDLLLLSTPEPGEGNFILCGHPFHLSHEVSPRIPTATAPVGWFETTLHDEIGRPDRDPNNLVLHLPPEIKKVAGENIKGISGCGIWCVRYERGRVLFDRAALVGIFHHFSKKGEWVRGTTLKYVLDTIVAHYPAAAAEVAKVKSI